MKYTFLLLAGLVCFSTTNQAAETVTKSDNLLIRQKLNTGWQFKQVGKEAWHAATVPGTVHTDLFNNKLINDPFASDEETRQQWIGNESWQYQTTIEVDATTLNHDEVDLVFYGLDTYAEVWLNGTKVLDANNMFRTWRISSKPYLKVGKNQLMVLLKSAYNEGLNALKQLPIQLVNDNDRGEFKTSVFTRKAQHHYGWDWGARFVTAGIWRPVEIQAWSKARIENIRYSQLNQSKKEANFNATFSINSTENQQGTITLSDENGKAFAVKKVILNKGDNRQTVPFTISNPKLWWPNGMGKPNLYTLKATLAVGNKKTTDVQQIGVRTFEVIQAPDSIGQSFLFKVNGIPTFMKGANYIPLDHFLPRVDANHYKKAVAKAKEANMNMLRIWGGGVYEDNKFYEECDKQGILVWQDFMFACSFYPWDKAYFDNVKEEAIQNVIRLRNHPSIALWCGNNEISEAWHNWGYQKVYKWSKEDSTAIWHGYLNLFEKLLPEVIKKEDASRFYWPSSPQYGWGSPKSLTHGDSHYWGVWWGKEPFETYEKKIPRFASEYGFQALPSAKTLEEYIPRSEWSTNSPIMKVHQKHSIGFDIIDLYLKRELPNPGSFDDLIYLSQILQGNGIALAIEAHRRNMPRCMGSLYWQFNDCWPVTSWSSMDYKLRPKALHFMAKKAFAPNLISSDKKEGNIEIYLVADHTAKTKGVLSCKLYNLSGGVLWQSSEKIEVKDNSSTLVKKISETALLQYADTSNLVLVTNFEGVKSFHYFSTIKNLKLEKQKYSLKLTNEKKGETRLTISAKNLMKNVFIDSANSELELTDNFFDIEPGETKTISIKSSKKIDIKDITIRSMFDYMK